MAFVADCFVGGAAIVIFYSAMCRRIMGFMVKHVVGSYERAESPKEQSPGQRRRIATPAPWVNVVV